MKTYKIRNTICRTLALTAVLTLVGTTGCSKKESFPVNPSGTPETTCEPIAQVDELFIKGDKDYFVPFQDPTHSYCTISDGLGTPVRHQGQGGCYSYSAVSTMQCAFLKAHGELIDINPIDLINRIYTIPEHTVGKEPDYPEEKYYPSIGPANDLGGDIYRVTGALCADPLNGYLISETNIYGNYNTEVSEFTLLSEAEVKEVIRKYGAVCMSVNYRQDCKEIHGYRAQNYQGDQIDHVATIVGWDDDFPADCFPTPAGRNGAWLVQNSFGEGWGNKGFYWVSFDMAIPGISSSQVTKEFSSALSYGRFSRKSLYSPDMISQKNFDERSLTDEDIRNAPDFAVASVYEKKGTVAAIGFWTSVRHQPYTVEIRDGEFGDVLATLSGSFDYAGYHTVKLETPVSVKKFTVIVKTPGLAVFEGPAQETKVSTIFRKVDTHYEAKTKPGQSFIQAGEDWIDVTDTSIKSKLGLDNDPNWKEYTTPGDPCITVLFI